MHQTVTGIIPVKTFLFDMVGQCGVPNENALYFSHV